MTIELVKAKGMGAYYFFCDKPTKKPTTRKRKISGRHLNLNSYKEPLLKNTFIYNTKK